MPIIAPKLPSNETLPSNPPTMTNSEKLYETAKSLLGQHLTLNANVSKELGCAECWSTIAKKAGVPGIPHIGFSGTYGAQQWLSTNPDWEEIQTPEAGAVIVAITEGVVHGHMGYFGEFGAMYTNDWGILSNDSNTGLLREQWSLNEWKKYYGNTLKLTTKYYRWITR